MDPALENIVKEVLQSHFKLMETGKLTSKKHLGNTMIPLLEQKASEFAAILNRGVQVRSGVHDINNVRFRVLRQDDVSLKIRASADYMQKYLHNGKEILTPSDPESYTQQNQIEDYESGYYDLNFAKNASGGYELIGLDDSIMGNRLGQM